MRRDRGGAPSQSRSHYGSAPRSLHRATVSGRRLAAVLAAVVSASYSYAKLTSCWSGESPVSHTSTEISVTPCFRVAAEFKMMNVARLVARLRVLPTL